MTTKFIVLDNSTYPHQAQARLFDHHLDLINYLTDYGIKYKKIYSVDKEITFDLNPALAKETK
jgi:hypothetical protein